MNVPFICLSATIVCALPAAAQETRRSSPQEDVALVSLRSLAEATVFQRQPAGDSGTAAFVPFASIRDVTFAPDGRMLALVLEAPEKANKTPERRDLPAASLVWDAPTKRWCTDDPNLSFEALAPTIDAAPLAESTARTTERTLRASALIDAAYRSRAEDSPVPASAGTPKAPAATLWLAPSQRSLVFVTLEHDGKHVPVPWAALELGDARDKVVFRLDSIAPRLADAPACDRPGEPPTAELRRRAYDHFRIPTPKWEASTEPGATGKDRGGKPER